jgi:hypothetical protein
MKKLTAMSVCFLIGGSLMVIAQDKGESDVHKTIATATLENPFVNSLGMKFVPVPGSKALFSIWLTRVQDFLAYAQAQPGTEFETTVKVDGTVGRWWKNPGFKQENDHPVVYVNLQEAGLFCAWLTNKERAEGKIGQDETYRLPTDKEWSAVVGTGKYPWGNDWPPPKGAIKEFKPNPAADDAGKTFSVGKYAANQYGLYDMTGDVWQWCGGTEKEIEALMPRQPDSELEESGETGIIRGASWRSLSSPKDLLSSSRSFYPAKLRRDDYGFRCVLAPRHVFTAPAAPIRASIAKWNGGLGGSVEYPESLFSLMGHGFFQSAVSPEMDGVIKQWLADHPKAVLVPVHILGPLTQADPDSDMVIVWIVDGRENLNVELVRRGCIYPETQMFNKDEKLEIPQAEYDAFVKKLTDAGKDAEKKNLGIWKTDAVWRNMGAD